MRALAADRRGYLPGGDRLAGLRHLVQDEPDPDWLDRPEAGHWQPEWVSLAPAIALRAMPSAGCLAWMLALQPRARSEVLWFPGQAGLPAIPYLRASPSI